MTRIRSRRPSRSFAPAAVCLLAAAMTVISAGVPATAAQPLPAVVSLNTDIVVNSSEVRLGDVFANAGRQAAAIVAAAPQPGARTVIDQRRLGAIAVAYGLDWRPASEADRTTVTRDGVLLSAEDIDSVLRRAVAARGLATPPFAIDLMGAPPQIALATGVGASLEVRSLTVDPASKRFQALLVPTGDGAGDRRFAVGGRIYPVTAVPVLVRAVARGEAIMAADLDLAEVREDRLAGGTATSEVDLIGMSARRPLRPGVPLRIADLQKQVVIAKGDPVLLVIAVPGMTLTARGRALENAAIGDPVRAVNLQGNGTVDGIATGAGRIQVVTAATPDKSIRR